MKAPRWRLLWVLLMGLDMAAACMLPATTTDCDQVVDKRLLSIDVAKLTTQEQVRQWAKEQYVVSDTAIEFQDNIPGRSIVSWPSTKGFLEFYFTPSGQAIEFFWDWKKDPQPPSVVSQVLRCLGEPTHYYAGYVSDGRRNLELELWYLNRGIMIRAYRGQSFMESVLRIIPTFDANLPVEMVFVAIPDSVRGVYQALFSSTPIRLWPGSLDKIIVDEARQ